MSDLDYCLFNGLAFIILRINIYIYIIKNILRKFKILHRQLVLVHLSCVLV